MMEDTRYSKQLFWLSTYWKMKTWTTIKKTIRQIQSWCSMESVSQSDESNFFM